MSAIAPNELIQQQLDAYNTRDLDRFMSFWADDAELRTFDGELLAAGAKQIRGRHSLRFQEANLRGHLIKRIVAGDVVIDHKIDQRTFPDGTGQVEVLAAYETAAGKIKKVWLRAGTPVLDEADWWLNSRWDI